MTRVVASDIISMSHCPRRLWYEKNPPEDIGRITLNPFETLIAEMGLEHERVVRDRLAGELELTEATSAAHTRELMDAGAPAIYQAELFDETNDLLGKPDFLLRQADGLYRAADAKLARSVKKEIGVQVAFCRRLLGTDHAGLVYLGDGSVAEIGPEYDPPLNAFITEARLLLGDPERPEVFFGASKCGACPYYAICVPEFEEREDLSLLYDVRAASVPGLIAAGIKTISDLAAADPSAIPDIPYLKGGKKERAVLQAQAVKNDAMFKRSDIVLPVGTYVHFDIEANPLAPDGNEHVYLWGFLKPPYDRADFDPVWTDTHEDDRAGWDAFLAKVEAYRAEWPDVKLVHFAAYERTMIRAYAERYGKEDHATVTWLLDPDNGPLYDIQDAVTDNLVLPLSGYGLKAIVKHPKLVNFQWEDAESGSQWSVVQYVNFLNATGGEEREALKAAILGYNRDVTATYKLEQWLRTL